MPKYNVIIPVFNESGRIVRTCKAIKDFLVDKKNYHFIFVDDGSEDNTVELIKENFKGSEDVEVLPLNRNVGKGAAVKAGILHATGDYVCFIDGDMAYSFNHLTVLFRTLEEKLFDVVIGSRALGFKNSKRIAPLRRFLGGSFNMLVRYVTGLPYRDTQAGLKGFNLQKARVIFDKIHDTRFWFDVEVLFIAKKLGYEIGEIPAIVASEHTLKNTRVKLFSDTLRMLFGILKIHIYNFRGDYDL